MFSVDKITHNFQVRIQHLRKYVKTLKNLKKKIQKDIKTDFWPIRMLFRQKIMLFSNSAPQNWSGNTEKTQKFTVSYIAILSWLLITVDGSSHSMTWVPSLRAASCLSLTICRFLMQNKADYPISWDDAVLINVFSTTRLVLNFDLWQWARYCTEKCSSDLCKE